jgi:hypothetical protein
MHLVLPTYLPLNMAHEEQHQLEEALCTKFGKQLDASITPMPCHGLFCKYCDRNCFDRTEDFIKHLNWTPEMLMADKIHVPPKVICIEDPDRKD